MNFGWCAEIEWWSKQSEDNLIEAEVMLIAQKEIGRWTFIVHAPYLDHGLVGADTHKWFSLGYRGEMRYWVNRWLTLGIQEYGTIGQLQVPTRCQNFDEVLCKANFYFGSSGSSARDVRLWRQ